MIYDDATNNSTDTSTDDSTDTSTDDSTSDSTSDSSSFVEAASVNIDEEFSEDADNYSYIYINPFSNIDVLIIIRLSPNSPAKICVDASQFNLVALLEARINNKITSTWPSPIDWDEIKMHKIRKFFIDQVTNITSSCIICQKPFDIEIFRPMTCTNELCLFTSISYGIGTCLEYDIMNNTKIVELLISCAFFATCGKIEHCKPLPDGYSVSQMRQYLSTLPPMRCLKEMAENDTLKTDLTQYSLCRWILSTYNCYIEYMTDTTPLQQLSMKLPPNSDVYLYKMAGIDKERRFQDIDLPSVYAFHGSAPSNWHNILREGLKPKNYVCAYGPGIYLATSYATSMGYTNAMTYDNLNYYRVRIMALCEIKIDVSAPCNGKVHRPKCKHNTGSPHYRVEDPDYLITRYIFVISK
jgi:hypothetical protein